jgi:tetratricopeptide (TPR) repeat protein
MWMRGWIAGFLALAALTVAAWFGWQWLTPPAPPELPLEQMEQGVARSIGDALEGVRRQPRSAEAWGNLALETGANGYTDQALFCLEQAERLDPADPRWPYLHGHLLQDGRTGDPLPYWRRAVESSRTAEERTTALHRLVLGLIEAGHLDEAEIHVRALENLDLAEANERAQLARGLLAMGRDDFTSAQSHLTRVAANIHARKLATGNLATIAVAAGDRDLARFYQQRAARFPDDAHWPDAFVDEMDRHAANRDARVRAAARLEDAGRLPEAIALLRQTIASTPDASAYLALGIALTKRGPAAAAAGKEPNFAEAEEALKTALRLDPHQMHAHHFLATIRFLQAEQLLERGDKAHAQDLFREVIAAEDRALAIKPFDPFAHLTRGGALRHLGRTQEALDSLRAAVSCRPGLAEAHLALGEALGEAGQLPEALVQLRDAVRFADPADRRPQQALEKWQDRAKH